MNKEPLKPLRRDKSGGVTGNAHSHDSSPPSSTPSAPDAVRNPEITQRAHQFASIIRAYYLALLAQGFAHEDAMTLTVAYQTAVAAAGQEAQAPDETE